MTLWQQQNSQNLAKVWLMTLQPVGFGSVLQQLMTLKAMMV